MTLTKEIQATTSRAEIQKGNIVAENFSYYFAGELDVVSINKSGYVGEFEVKVSRADFRADAKKIKWDYYDNPDSGYNCKYTPNYFTYVCPAGIIKPEEIKPYMGLIYFTPGCALEVIQKPKLIHRYKHDAEKLLRKIATVNNWKAYFGAQRLTLMGKETDPEKVQDYIDKLRHVSANHGNKLLKM